MPLKVSVKLIVLKSGRSGAGTVSGLRKIRKVETRCDLADPVGWPGDPEKPGYNPLTFFFTKITSFWI